MNSREVLLILVLAMILGPAIVTCMDNLAGGRQMVNYNLSTGRK